MRYDIDYIIQTLLPNLSKNEAAKTLQRNIIPNELTFEVEKVYHNKIILKSENNFTKTIMLLPKQNNTDDDVEQLEFFTEYPDIKDGASYQASESISTNKSGNTTYSYLEQIEGPTGRYYQATTATAQLENEKVTFDNIKIGKWLYGNDVIKGHSELNFNFQEDSNFFTPDYYETLSDFDTELTQNYFIASELQFYLNITKIKDNLYRIERTGDFCTPKRSQTYLMEIEKEETLSDAYSVFFQGLQSALLENRLDPFSTKVAEGLGIQKKLLLSENSNEEQSILIESYSANSYNKKVFKNKKEQEFQKKKKQIKINSVS